MNSYSRTKLKIQKKFSDKERQFCYDFFSLNDDETLMFIWWLNPLKKLGFVFTDKRLLYNIHVRLFGEDDIEIYHQDSGEILLSPDIFQGIIFESKVLKIQTTEKKYIFNLNIKLTESDKNLLEKIVKDYFCEMKTPFEEYCRFRNSFILNIGYILNKISIPDIAAKTATYTKKGAVAVASFLRHLLDGLLDICSFATILFCALPNSTITLRTEDFQYTYERLKEIAAEKMQSVLFVFIASCIYSVLKFLIILTTRKIKKLPPILLIAVQILLCFITTNNNLPFILAINFLLIFVFQQICGFSKKSIEVKFSFYFGILLASYFAISLILIHVY